MSVKKIVAISGASGFVGSCLKRHLLNSFHILPIKREELDDKEKLASIIDSSHIVINLSGASVLSRWTQKRKHILRSSRLKSTKKLVNAINASKNKPELFISTSAVGIYDSFGIHDENRYSYADDFLAQLCKDWEEEALKSNVRTVIFRLGVVLGEEAGAYKQMIVPFRFGFGGKIGSGKQGFSCIHILDLMRAYEFVINNKRVDGVLNLVCPEPTTNKDFTNTLATNLKRPAFFTVPSFILKLLYADGAIILTSGQKVKPSRLLEYGFKFRFSTSDEIVKDLVCKDKYKI